MASGSGGRGGVRPEASYRGTSLIRKRTTPGPYRRPMPRVLGGWALFLARYPCRPGRARLGMTLEPLLYIGRNVSWNASSELSLEVPPAGGRRGVGVGRGRLGTGVPHLQENASPWDPTVGLCLETYGDPRGAGVFLSSRYSCTRWSHCIDIGAIRRRKASPLRSGRRGLALRVGGLWSGVFGLGFWVLGFGF